MHSDCLFPLMNSPKILSLLSQKTTQSSKSTQLRSNKFRLNNEWIRIIVSYLSTIHQTNCSGSDCNMTSYWPIPVVSNLWVMVSRRSRKINLTGPRNKKQFLLHKIMLFSKFSLTFAGYFQTLDSLTISGLC